jgi:hypothetical protein
MKTYGDDFLGELEATYNRAALALVIHFPAPRGDLYLSTRPLILNGNNCDVVISAVGPIGSESADGGRPLRIDGGGATIALDNMLTLSTGERLSSVLPRDLDGIAAELYLAFLPAPLVGDPFLGATVPDEDKTPIATERLFAGFLRGNQQTPAQYGYKRCALRLASYAEAYLSGSALDTVLLEEFPYARSDAVNQTIPVVHGRKKLCPGRVIRSSLAQATQPEGDANNGGSASLKQVDAASGVSSEDWAILFSPGNVAEQTNSDAEWTPSKSTPIAYQNSSTASGSYYYLAWNHTFSGNRRVAVVFAVTAGPYGAQICNIAGRPATAVCAWTVGFNAAVIQLFVLVDPPAGSQQVYVWWGTPIGHAAHCVALTEADAAGFLGAAHGRIGGISDGPTIWDPGAGSLYGIALTDWIVDGLFVAPAPSSGPTPDSPQVQRTSTTAIGAERMSTKTPADAGLGLGMTHWTWSSTPGGYLDGVGAALINRRVDVRARSFTVTGSGAYLKGVKVHCKKNTASTLPGIVRAAVLADASGAPGAVLSVGSAPVNSTTAADVLVTLGADLPNGTYWVAAWCDVDRSGIGSVTISTLSGSGTYRAGSVGARPGATNLDFTGSSGTTGDLRFAVVFAATAYTLTGSQTGANGSGYATTDFTSTDGKITIKSQYWEGLPLPGDIFRFSTSTGTPRVIFSDSPEATPVQAINTVYFDDGSGFTADPSSIVSKLPSVLDGTRYVAEVTFNASIPEGTQVYADIYGIQDDAEGTYSGSPGGLLQIPADVIAWWLGARARVPLGLLDQALTFPQTRALEQGLYTFAGVVQEDQTIQEVLLRFAYEARAELDWTGDLCRLHHLPTAGPIVRVLDLAEIPRSDEEPQITVERIPPEEMVNELRLEWNRVAYSGAYASSFNLKNQASIEALKGSLRRPDLASFDFVTDFSMIRSVATYYLAAGGSPGKRRFRATCLATALPIEKGDIIGLHLLPEAGVEFPVIYGGGGSAASGSFPITLDQTGNLADSFDGLDGGQAFRVDAKTFDPSNFTVTLVGHEIDLAENLAAPPDELPTE